MIFVENNHHSKYWGRIAPTPSHIQRIPRLTIDFQP